MTDMEKSTHIRWWNSSYYMCEIGQLGLRLMKINCLLWRYVQNYYRSKWPYLLTSLLMCSKMSIPLPRHQRLKIKRFLTCGIQHETERVRHLTQTLAMNSYLKC